MRKYGRKLASDFAEESPLDDYCASLKAYEDFSAKRNKESEAWLGKMREYSKKSMSPVSEYTMTHVKGLVDKHHSEQTPETGDFVSYWA